MRHPRRILLWVSQKNSPLRSSGLFLVVAIIASSIPVIRQPLTVGIAGIDRVPVERIRGTRRNAALRHWLFDRAREFGFINQPLLILDS